MWGLWISFVFQINWSSHRSSALQYHSLQCEECGEGFNFQTQLKQFVNSHISRALRYYMFQVWGVWRRIWFPNYIEAHISHVHYNFTHLRCFKCGKGFVSKHKLKLTYIKCIITWSEELRQVMQMQALLFSSASCVAILPWYILNFWSASLPILNGIW